MRNMRRKLIKQGNNSYTLTLPIKWIREYEIKDNAELEINREDNSLLISLPINYKKPASSIHLDLEDYNERTIRNILNQNYRKGYNQIILSYNTEEQLKHIRKITRSTLLGFEIVKEEMNKCYVESIAEPSNERFSVILRKIFHTIQHESSEIIKDIQNNNIKNIGKYQESKDLVDTYTNFCRRLIIKERIPELKSSYQFFLVVSHLSLIYHSFYYMYKFASSQKNLRLTKKTSEILSKLPNLFILLHEAFYENDLRKAHKIGMLKDELIFSSLYKIFESTRGPENVILFHIGEIIRLIHLSSINIFSLTDHKKIE